MPTTPTLGLRYPAAADPADVPSDLQKLAQDVEAAVLAQVGAVPTMPSGAMVPYGGAVAPAGWLLCDGSAVARTGATAALFAAIGTTFGPGNGTTTFNVPDLRDRVAVGSSGSKARGSTGGEESHLISVGELPSHNHGGNTAGGTLPATSTSAGATGSGTTGSDSPDHAHNGSTSGLGDHQHGSVLGAGADNEFVVAGLQGDPTSQLWGAGTGGRVRAVSTTGSAGGHSHSVSVGGATARHAHSVPSLSIPALSIPAQAIPPLAIASQGGGAPANNMQPYLAVTHIIKT